MKFISLKGIKTRFDQFSGNVKDKDKDKDIKVN